MSERQKFHPLAILIHAFHSIRGWFFLIIIFFLNGGHETTFGIIGFITFLLLNVIVAVVKYFSQTYQITSQKIIIYSGIFKKRETDIPYDRIQTVKQRQWFFFRPFNLVQILIETAGGSGAEAEGSMPAVHESQLQLIENYRQRKDETIEVETTEPTTGYDYEVTNGQIFIYGLTDLSIIATLFAVIAFAAEYIPERWVDSLSSTAEMYVRAGWLVITAVVMLVLILIAIVSLVKTFIQYFHFRVNRNGSTLTIESGLFERKVQKIPIDKIQGIKIRQQIVRKWFKLSSVEIFLAGGQEATGEGANMHRFYLLPIIRDDKLYEILQLILPEWNFQKPAITYTSRSNPWYFFRWNALLLIVAAGLIYYQYWAVLAGLLIFQLIWFLTAWLDTRYQGYAIQTENRICFQTFELFTKVQTFIERPKIQSLTERTSRWLYPKNIAHLTVFLKTGQETGAVALKFIQRTDKDKILAFYQQKSPDLLSFVTK